MERREKARGGEGQGRRRVGEEKAREEKGG